MKRFLKIVAILALFMLGIGYVAFRVIFFDPFAGGPASLDPLVPKDVDFMVRRKGLKRDFTEFPLPRLFASLSKREEWKDFVRTRLYREEIPVAAIEQAFAELATLPAQIAPLDVMADIAGREVLLCGRYRADQSIAWAAIARGSFRMKLIVDALAFAAVRRWRGDLISEWSEKEDVQSFVAQGERWHLARVDDAILVGNDFELVRDMRKLADADGLSLADSPQYRAQILSASPAGRPIDFAVDVGNSMRQFGLELGPPAPDDSGFRRIARDLLVPERFGPALGRVALGNQLDLTFSATIDRPALAPLAAGLLDGTSGDFAQAWNFCGMAFPAKVAAAVHVKVDMRKLLRRLESLIDPDWRRILNEDFFPNLKFKSGQIQARSLAELFESFAGIVGDELAFAFEPNDPYSPPAAPGVDPVIEYPDPRHGPRLAFILPAGDRDIATQFVTSLVDALRTRVREVPTVYTWSYPHIDDVKFSELKLADGSFPNVAIGVLDIVGRPCVVITTTGAMLDEICVQKMTSESGHNTGLQSELAFRQAQESAKGFGQGFAYLSSDRLRRVCEELCVVFAEDETRPDWVKIRREAEARVIAAKHPELRGKTLDAKQRLTVDLLLDDEIEQLERAWLEQTVPARIEEMKRDLRGLSIFRWATLLFSNDERELDLKLRLAAPITFGDTLGDTLGG
ncbi:MAG: hypothetical protein EXS13_08600 [Planctomycetes bacterium]|nr:hypothetical protein [Planctomycetota bacterium]